MEQNNFQEAKKEMLRNYVNILNELIIERYRSLSIISGISFAFLGISIFSFDSSLIKTKFLTLISFIFLIAISLISLGRYIYLTRKGICEISQKIEGLANKDLTKLLLVKEPSKDYWVEILYIGLITAILIFLLSFVDFCNLQYFLL